MNAQWILSCYRCIVKWRLSDDKQQVLNSTYVQLALFVSSCTDNFLLTSYRSCQIHPSMLWGTLTTRSILEVYRKSLSCRNHWGNYQPAASTITTSVGSTRSDYLVTPPWCDDLQFIIMIFPTLHSDHSQVWSDDGGAGSRDQREGGAREGEADLSTGVEGRDAAQADPSYQHTMEQPCGPWWQRCVIR